MFRGRIGTRVSTAAGCEGRAQVPSVGEVERCDPYDAGGHMPRFPRPRGRAALRAAIAAVAAAVVAVALGAMHGGAATPATQSVTVPNKAGQAVSVAWTGTIPAVSPHPTSDCNGAGVGDDDEGITVTIPRKGYDRFDATFTFSINWTPSNPTGQETLNDEVLTVNSADGQDPADTTSSPAVTSTRRRSRTRGASPSTRSRARPPRRSSPPTHRGSRSPPPCRRT